MKSAQTGEEWLGVAKEQFGVANERQAKLDDLTSQVTKTQLAGMENANTWASEDRSRYKTVFQPMEDKFIDTAQNWASPEKQAEAAGEAKADVLGAAQTAQQARERQMTGMGVNPASGRFAGVVQAGDTATALASAGAQNTARTTLRNQAVALQSDAINMGKGLPSQATQALGLGTQTGNSVVGNNVATNNAWMGSNDLLKSGYQTAIASYGQQANILNTRYGKEIDAWKAQQDASSAEMGGLMKGIGGIAGLFMPSDENAKEDKVPAKGALDAVKGLPVEEWSYKPGEGDGGRHIGTYAQDFQRETGKGDGKSIPIIDAIGVTMGAVKELDAKVEKLTKSIGAFNPKTQKPRSRGVMQEAA
ncbi:tail fiber domain-containing protein [Xanthobacter sp. DSM 24535]|uniref:tail fiber domain-containing protein n=1 Tax=Roseixanthobacter psychrophilus TaxID=3119917 RepID=UPI00372CBB58